MMIIVLERQFSQCGRKFSSKHDKLLKKKMYLQSQKMRTTPEIKDIYQARLQAEKVEKFKAETQYM